MTKRVVNILIGIILGILLKYEICIFNLILLVLIETFLIIFTKKYFIYSILFFIIFYFIVSFDIESLDSNFSDTVKVIEVHDSYYIVSNNLHKFIIYCDESFNLYSKINIDGTLKLLETNKSLNVSSFNDYLYTQGVYYCLSIDNYEIMSKGDVVRPFIQNIMLSELSDDSKEFVKLLVLGIKDNSDFYDNVKTLGVVHLFVISGFHLNIVYFFIKKIFKKVNDKILVFLLIPYLYLLNFSIPVLRAFIFILIKAFKKNKEFNGLLTLMICAIGLLFIDYHNLFNLSFQFTFITNLIIIIMQNVSENSVLFRNIIRPIIIQLSVLPITLNLNYEFNVLSIINTIILSFTMEYLLGLCFITSIIKVSDPLLNILTSFYKKGVNELTKINTTLIFGKMNCYVILIFYILLIILLVLLFYRRIKYSILVGSLLLSLMTIQYYKNNLFEKAETIFINVGQGDCTLVIGENCKYCILIDTGGSKDFDVATKRIIPLLKSKGIKKLDAVIITHDDYDHNGALESLNENYEIEKIIYSQSFYSININGLLVTNYNHYYNDNSDNNDTSGVLHFQNGKYKYLIMGDASTEIEKKIIQDYKLDVDILKVGHHGSKTSTCDEFIKSIKPNYGIISVGYNTYGHPTQVVLNILENNDVLYYRTDKSYSVCFNDKNIIEKY